MRIDVVAGFCLPASQECRPSGTLIEPVVEPSVGIHMAVLALGAVVDEVADEVSDRHAVDIACALVVVAIVASQPISPPGIGRAVGGAVVERTENDVVIELVGPIALEYHREGVAKSVAVVIVNIPEVPAVGIAEPAIVGATGPIRMRQVTALLAGSDIACSWPEVDGRIGERIAHAHQSEAGGDSEGREETATRDRRE